MPESVGFQYWRDSSMLLGVSSKNQEKMRDDWENLMNENKFYLRKIEKLREEIKKLKEDNRRLMKERNYLGDYEGGATSEEEDPDCCERCGKRFDLQYTLNHCEPELSKKYEKYMGSPEDDGDMCHICMDSEN
jgi:hypothetical protein